MERYVAIDNVCAWPNLTLMPDGDIVATIFNKPTHGKCEGDVDCWASTDGGRTWQWRGTPAPHEPTTNRMNVAAGLASDGSLVVLASGWSNRPPEPPDDGSFGQGEVLGTWVCRSGDGGRTWTRGEAVELPANGVTSIIPFGDIVPVGEGRLATSFYSCQVPEENSAFCYSSDDDGVSWGRPVAIQEGNTNETALLCLDDGCMLAAVRTLGDQHLRLFRSDDAGETWIDEGPLTTMHQHPAHLVRLADGRVLLTYGLRNPDLHGVGYRLSGDAGKTWGQPRILVDLECPADCGYPSSVQNADGTIVTAYYASRTPAHTRYHMGVVRWRAEA